MLNPFYSYIGNQLASFFQKEATKGKTERYYLYLPSEELVSSLYEVLKAQKNSEQFSYLHEAGLKSYETIALSYGEYKYVIATTNENTTVDFLVTLRNEMSRQLGQWKNTSIILLCNTLNDSIKGGSRDLTSEGLPLHVSEIVGNLEDLMSKSDLTATEKAVTRHYLKRRESEHRIENSSFLDFEDILTLVNKGEVTSSDYLKLHYFPDLELENLVQEKTQYPTGSGKWNSLERLIENRLTENTLQHEEVERLRSLGNPKEKLEEQFDKGGAKLVKDEWYEVDYTSIIDWKEQMKLKRDISFESDKVKAVLLNDEKKLTLDVWKRPKSTSASGLRNWSFIVFHPQYKEGECIEIAFPFDRSTQTRFLNSTSKKFAVTKGSSIVASIKLESEGSTFQRVVYQHEDTTSGKYTFNIVVVACEPSFLESQSDSFIVEAASKSKFALQLDLDNQELTIGDNSNEIKVLDEYGQILDIGIGATIHFEAGLLDDSETSLRFSIKTPKFTLPIIIKDEMFKSIPISGAKLWEMKRSKQSSFTIDKEAKKIEIDHLPYSTFEKDRPFLLMEASWLKQRVKQAMIMLNELKPVECTLPPAVDHAYNAFLDAVSESGTVPSLLYYSGKVKEKAEAYIESFVEAIESIREQQIMTNEERALYLLGCARDENIIYMTPFSPLNVVFQLQINKETTGDTIDSNILRRLKAVYTLPYIIDSIGEIFKPTTDNNLPEWLAYLPREEVTVGETNNYLAKVVEEKLEQFYDHYDYLFALESSTSLLLNVINIPNDHEVLRGIVDWLKGQIKRYRSLSGLRNIEVISYKYDEQGPSAFDELNGIGDAETIGNRLNIDFSMKDYLADDVLRAIQQVLHYSKRSIEAPIEYAHISFYKMKNEEQIVKQLVKQSPNSLNLNGLFTTVVSSKTDDGGYRAGFGVGNSDIKRSPLTHFAVKMNELVANMTNRGQDPYSKDIAFAMHINTQDEVYLSELYARSHWLTFIDPAVDLKYFQESSKNLVIVHYSDQHSSSNHYDAITITDKSNQYFKVIKDFLKSQKVNVEDSQIEDVIRAFNTFNGEWLLRAVQGRAHDKREKMSVVSAIKQSLQLFDRTNVMWVPISMEEIVRVTGNVKLSRKDGIFSGKTIGKRGNCSDDILMMGLEQKEGSLKFHMYPVEVKIGNNANDVIEKGIRQVIELKSRLDEQLIDEKTFDARFLRNFFVRLFINNATKMNNNRIWPERNYQLDPNVIDRLLNDEFEIVNSLRADLGAGMVLSFKKGAQGESRERKQGVIVIQLPEQYGYDTLAKPMNQLNELINEKNTISNAEKKEDLKVAEREITYATNKEEKIPDIGLSENPVDLLSGKDMKNEKSAEVTNIPSPLVEEIVETNLTGVRPLVGLENNRPVYWEFDHRSLSNRHLVIGGRSGQGKTYFIQSLLMDMAKSGQSAVVIDYSSSYTKKQLDDVFIQQMGDKLRERIVYHEGFPLNPFLLKQKEVAGIIGKEKPSEAARRIVDVFSSVYKNSFGAQQKSALYAAVKKGIELYGEKMRMDLLLEVLEELEGYGNQVITSISSRLVQLVDIDPFDYDAENQWKEYFAPGGNITIIQLAGYDQDEIKRLMAEFILWDLWYYTQDGSKDKAIPVILDEAQNLDFSDGSPSAKILREGRKFGWSAWFATQTFNNFSKDELSILDNAGTKIYFNPAESELRVIAGRIGNASTDELRMLQKGQCLVMGQFMRADKELGNPTYHVVTVPALDAETRK
ncbi:DNA phosphorothioation-dependent restriction protein DptH [Psychrobacillus sp. OK032]|uniref:DNA phosphorothioation-dependent restriction protein DptH n=1 Tax=Psychrobacillus sp. OK032 TaxID=1884358 RepID=UPI0008C9716B|nr:DNA phosphorothioation-dependent restriction protein DptH [Psychrobacillus sp. OK032]SES25538.1 DNA phosphorothioation-dependent restriction protein DptH [Psychrobacillus sp. OK032]